VENKPVLKSAMFGGFERQSVLNYIYETVNSTQEAQDRLTAQIEEMSVTREKLEHSVKELEFRLSDNEAARDSLGEELRGVKVKNNELNGMLQTLNEEIDRQKGIVREKDEQLKRVNQIKAELERENADLQLRASQAVDGQEDVEKTKLRVGELMVKSHLEAEQVIDRANFQARQIVDQAGVKAKEVIAQADFKARMIEEEADKSAHSLSGQLTKFRVEIGSIEEKLERAIVNMRENFSVINEVISHGETHIKSFSRSERERIVLAPSPSDTGTEQLKEFF